MFPPKAFGAASIVVENAKININNHKPKDMNFMFYFWKYDRSFYVVFRLKFQNLNKPAPQSISTDHEFVALTELVF